MDFVISWENSSTNTTWQLMLNQFNPRADCLDDPYTFLRKDMFICYKCNSGDDVVIYRASVVLRVGDNVVPQTLNRIARLEYPLGESLDPT